MGFIIDCKSPITNYWNRTDTTMAYFDEIRKYDILTVDEERKLLELIKNGSKSESEKARERLINCNQRFVASIARRFSTSSNLLDLINEANVGLITAIDKFDLSYKGRFLTYAVFWMRKYMNDYIILKERIIQPINAHKIYAYANKARERFFIEHNRYPNESELQEYLLNKYGIEVANKDDLSQYSMLSIDSSISTNENDESEENVGDFAIATSVNNVLDDIERMDNRNIVNFLLKRLPERSQEIMRRYYGIDRKEECINNISIDMKLSRERIRQIIGESLEILKDKDYINKKKKQKYGEDIR